MSVTLAIALRLLEAAPSSAPCTDVVEGRVVDDTTDEPVVGAVVRLGDASVVTDDTGHFELHGICKGDHSLTVERLDFHTVQRDVSVDGDTEVDVHALPREIEHEDHVLVRVSEAPQTETRASTTLEGEALARTRGKGLADALSGVAGVQVLRSSAGGLGKPIIRGQVGRRVLILNGGVRHEAQRWGLDHAPEIDPLSAGSITVIKGAGSIRYGPDAVGGVVLVEPPPLPRTPGVFGQTNLIGVSNGRQGIATARLDGAHRRLPGFAWRAEGNVSRGAARVAPDYALDNTGSLVWNAGATVGYLGDGVEATLSYRRHFTKAGLCTCLVVDSVESFQQSVARGQPVGVEHYDSEYLIERAFQRVTHDMVTARARMSLGRAGELTAVYAFQDNERQEFDVVREGVSGPQLEFDLRTHGGDLAFEHAPVTLGDGLWLEGTAGASTAYQTNDFSSNGTLIPDYRQGGGGVFVIERVVTEPFDMQWGVRYDGMRRSSTLEERDYLGQLARGRIDATDCEDTPDGGGRCSYPFHAVSGSYGVRVHATEALDLRLDLASAARFPNVDELFANGSAPSLPMVLEGDASLGVERTWGSSLTAAWSNRWLATETSGYLNYIDDYILLAPQGFTTTIRGEFPRFAFSPVDAVFYGGEHASTVAPPRWPVSLDAQVSLVRARNASDHGFLTFIPPDRYRLGITYRWPEAWRLRNGFVSVGGMVVDRQRRFDLGADFAAPPPAYFLLGAAAGVQLPLGEQVLSLGLEGGNLTNARYRQYTSLLRYFADEPGWEIRLRLSLDFVLHGKAGHQHR
ncbi:MAG: TonB-dependent receptor [Myxococcales bacterium]|nr:TonB-dependent receptor [Myxococcales bacterium]